MSARYDFNKPVMKRDFPLTTDRQGGLCLGDMQGYKERLHHNILLKALFYYINRVLSTTAQSLIS